MVLCKIFFSLGFIFSPLRARKQKKVKQAKTFIKRTNKRVSFLKLFKTKTLARFFFEK
jgi:hypothetical protein